MYCVQVSAKMEQGKHQIDRDFLSTLRKQLADNMIFQKYITKYLIQLSYL